MTHYEFEHISEIEKLKAYESMWKEMKRKYPYYNDLLNAMERIENKFIKTE